MYATQNLQKQYIVAKLYYWTGRLIATPKLIIRPLYSHTHHFQRHFFLYWLWEKRLIQLQLCLDVNFSQRSLKPFSIRISSLHHRWRWHRQIVQHFNKCLILRGFNNGLLHTLVTLCTVLQVTSQTENGNHRGPFIVAWISHYFPTSAYYSKHYININKVYVDPTSPYFI